MGVFTDMVKGFFGGAAPTNTNGRNGSTNVVDRLCNELGWPVDERDGQIITLHFKDPIVGIRRVSITCGSMRQGSSASLPASPPSPRHCRPSVSTRSAIGCPSHRRRITCRAASSRTSGAPRRCPGCGRWAKWPAPVCTEPTGWRPTRCSKGWSSAPAWPSASPRAPAARSPTARFVRCWATRRLTASHAPKWRSRPRRPRRCRRTRTGGRAST